MVTSGENPGEGRKRPGGHNIKRVDGGIPSAQARAARIQPPVRKEPAPPMLNATQTREFEMLFESQRPKLVARVRSTGIKDADNFANETFAKALAAGGDINAGLLHRILTNLLIDDFRHRKMARGHGNVGSLEYHQQLLEQVDTPDMPHVPDTAHDQAVAREMGVHVRRSLSTQKADVFKLSNEGYSEDEIAEILKISPNAGRMRLMRARNAGGDAVKRYNQE